MAQRAQWYGVRAIYVLKEMLFSFGDHPVLVISHGVTGILSNTSTLSHLHLPSPLLPSSPLLPPPPTRAAPKINIHITMYEISFKRFVDIYLVGRFKPISSVLPSLYFPYNLL